MDNTIRKQFTNVEFEGHETELLVAFFAELNMCPIRVEGEIRFVDYACHHCINYKKHSLGGTLRGECNGEMYGLQMCMENSYYPREDIIYRYPWQTSFMDTIEYFKRLRSNVDRPKVLIFPKPIKKGE